MRRLIVLILIMLAGSTGLFAQANVGIGVTTPSDKLHINCGAGENPLLVQVNSSTKLRVFANGGTSIGTVSTPPVNGLLVVGAIQPQSGISTPSKMIIESTGDSILINAGSSQIIVASNGNITIKSSTGKIVIDAATTLTLTGTTVTLQASGTLNLNGGSIRFNGGSKKVAGIGDAISTGGTITTGSSNVFSN